MSYRVDESQKEEEIAWLKSFNVFPATYDYYDWKVNKLSTMIGVIVSKESANLIKLKHSIDIQTNYYG